MSKKKMSYEKKIQIINTIVIVIILGFYSFRLFYYKAKVTQPQDVSGNTYFSDVVKDFTYVDVSKADRIHKNSDDTYTYIGKDVDNYVEYSNMLFRILGVDEEGNIKLISEESIGISTLNETTEFKDTALYAFLNSQEGDENSGYVEKALNKYSAYKSFYGEIGLLTLDEYKKANGQSSFLNNGQKYWLMSQDENGQYYFVDENGSVASSYSDYLTLSVRFTVSIKYSAILLSGNGKIDNPYVLSKDEATTLNDVGTGAYVIYSGKLFRIINNGGVYAIDMDKNNECSYGDIDALEEKTGIYSYLNNTYLKQLNNYEEYLLQNTWNYGTFDDSYSYKDCLLKEYDGYVSLPILSTLFLDNEGEYLIGSIDEFSNEYVYSIKENTIFGVSLEEEDIIRAVIRFNPEVEIVSGDGTLDSPYIIEVTNEVK